jgi:hypothetical protein
LRENRFVLTGLPLLAGGGTAMFAMAAFLNGLPAKIIFSSVGCVLVTAAMWRWMLTPREKMALRSGLRERV